MDDRAQGLGREMFNFNDDDPAMISIVPEKLDGKEDHQNSFLTRREATSYARRKFEETLTDLPAVKEPDMLHMLKRMAVMEGATRERLDTEKLDWNIVDTAHLMIAFREDTREMTDQGRHELALQLAGEVNETGHYAIERNMREAGERLQERLEPRSLETMHQVITEGATGYLRKLEGEMAAALATMDRRGLEEAIESMGRAEKDLRNSTMENARVYGEETFSQLDNLRAERLEAIQETFMKQAAQEGCEAIDPSIRLAEQLQAQPQVQEHFARFLAEIDIQDAREVMRHTTRQINRAGGSGWDTETSVHQLISQGA